MQIDGPEKIVTKRVEPTMHQSNSNRRILGFLASKFTDRREDLLTEALLFLLKSSPPIRTALEKHLESIFDTKIQVARVDSQVVVSEESRPDLATFDREGNLSSFIESKLWAGLTDAQPKEYLKRLQEANGKALLFVAPSQRVESIQREISVRLREQEGDLTFQLVGNAKRSVLKSGIQLGVTSWSSLIQVLNLAASSIADSSLLAEIYQVEGLIKEFESEAFTPISGSTLTNLEIPKAIVNLTDVTSKALEVARTRGLINTDGLKWTTHSYGAGRYVMLGKAGVWIGFDSQTWLQYHASPLWIKINSANFGRASLIKPHLGSLASATPCRLFESEDGSLLIPVYIKPGTIEDEVIQLIVSQIEEVSIILSKPEIPDHPDYLKFREKQTGVA